MQVIQTRKRVQGIYHQDTLNSIANLASTYIYHGMDHQDTPSSIDNPRLSYIYQDHSNVRKREMITSLTNRIRDNIQIAEEDVAQVAGPLVKD